MITVGAALKVAANWANAFSSSDPATDAVAAQFAPSGSLALGFDLNFRVSLHVMATVPLALIGNTLKK
jgi:hypothetical protein